MFLQEQRADQTAGDTEHLKEPRGGDQEDPPSQLAEDEAEGEVAAAESP